MKVIDAVTKVRNALGYVKMLIRVHFKFLPKGGGGGQMGVVITLR